MNVVRAEKERHCRQGDSVSRIVAPDIMIPLVHQRGLRKKANAPSVRASERF